MYLVKFEWGLNKEREFDCLEDVVDALGGTGYEIYYDGDLVYDSKSLPGERDGIEALSLFPATIDHFLYSRISEKPLDVSLKMAEGYQAFVMQQMDQLAAYLYHQDDMNDKAFPHIAILNWDETLHLDYNEADPADGSRFDSFEQVAWCFHSLCFDGHHDMPVSIYVDGKMKYSTDTARWVHLTGGKMHFSQRHSDAVVAQLKA